MTSPAVPLDQPLYNATFGQAVGRFWRKYATFSGRASRSEYWWAYLFNVIIGVVLWTFALIFGLSGASVDQATGKLVYGPGFVPVMIIAVLWSLAILIPGLAVTWRRFHDTNKSGAFWFLAFIPVVGEIIVIVLLVLDKDPAGVRFDKR
ncbi:DUF805 domain-containing protein [Microbacterium sp. ASV49]|uniref:DUF805 domain-containing protein n=1 Tax=Microbacterium candidum TaxID=3041922 RepID=A0ABT7N1P4_9MICO|nr:DUF805 domain-containing protein [Microbacterium sp. ASV49]MDL9980637.1 DUF805 domain-containing protein [Microbacterium sp. ASV49]